MDLAMDLDELKLAWKTLDQRLERQSELQLAELHERRTRNLRSSLRPLAFGQALQMLFGVGAIVLGVLLWSTFTSITTVFVIGLIVHVYGIATIASAGAVLGGIARIDRTLPVVELQQRLARVRRAYIVSGAVIGLPWWLLWVAPPVVIVSLHNAQNGSTGLPAWLWLSLAVGVLGLLATWGFHRWLRRPGREDLAQRMHASAAGGSLRRAQAELDELERFARE
jgi:nicotinamide riboside transporter PnuC